MQVSLESSSGLTRCIKVGLPKDSYDGEINKRLQHLARTQRVKGFRPGKVPVSVIKKRFGQAVQREVAGELMQKSFFEAIQKEDLRPAGYPHFEINDQAQEQFEYTATFEVFPEVKVEEFSKVSVEVPEVVIGDKDVDDMLQTLQKQQGVWEDVRRMAKKDDMVIIDFVGSVDGEEFEGGKAENFEVVLGSNKLLPEFEKQLIKAKKDTEIDVNLTFPDDYHAENLRGKEALFKVTVKNVRGLKLPELDEEFAKKFNHETVESFTEEVSANMARELKTALRNKKKEAVFEQLLVVNEIDVPKALIDQEIERMRQEFAARMAQGNPNSATPDLPAQLFEEQANKKVKLELLVHEIVKKQELKPDETRVRETVEELASSYETPQEVVDWYYGEAKRLDEVKALVLEEQVIDSILAEAKVKKKKQSFKEIMDRSKP